MDNPTFADLKMKGSTGSTKNIVASGSLFFGTPRPNSNHGLLSSDGLKRSAPLDTIITPNVLEGIKAGFSKNIFALLIILWKK